MSTQNKENYESGSTENPRDPALDGTKQNPPDATQEAATEAETVPKPKTIPTTIRLTELAFTCLRVLEGKYPALNRAAIVSLAVIAYAKKAAAAPILKYRMLHHHVLFPLQASATDIKTGLQSLGQQLFEAKKSNRDPVSLKAAYDAVAAKQIAVLEHADDTLDLMAKELSLTEILANADHEMLPNIIDKLANNEPSIQFTNTERKQLLKILKLLLPL